MKPTEIGIQQKVNLLSRKDLLEIHRATLRVMKEGGVVFQHEKAVELLERAGATVTGQIVRFPEEMVEKTIRAVPGKLTLRSRNPEKDVHLGGDSLYYTNGYGATFVRDLETGRIREARLGDLVNFTRLADYLNNVHYVLTQVIPQDIPPDVVDVLQTAEMLRHTEKHVGLSIARATFIDEVIQIGRQASGLHEGEGCQNGVFSLGAVSLSPLMYSWDGCHRLMRMAQEEVVTRITSIPISGGTSPVTLAGTLVQANAEVLAGICLVQVISPGNPILYGFSGGPMDMIRGKQMGGSPEAALMNAAVAQLCDLYEIPFGYGTGGITDSSSSDQQCGFERAYTILYGALSGVNVVHHGAGGLLGGAMVSAYEDMVIANEICNMVNMGARGIRVTDDTLAVDLIKDVGPGGSFLDTDHTNTYFRDEIFLSNLLDRRAHDERDGGEPSILLVKAKELAKQVLANHRVPGFSPEVEKKIQTIVDGVLGEGSTEPDSNRVPPTAD